MRERIENNKVRDQERAKKGSGRNIIVVRGRDG